MWAGREKAHPSLDPERIQGVMSVN
jgi:hypothetical protein